MNRVIRIKGTLVRNSQTTPRLVSPAETQDVLRAVMTELIKLTKNVREFADPSVSGTPATQEIVVTIAVKDHPDPLDAVARSVSSLRTALEAATADSPGWAIYDITVEQVSEPPPQLTKL